MLMITRLINYPVKREEKKEEFIKCSGGWCKNPARPGFRVCEACLNRAKSYYARNRETVLKKQKVFRDKVLASGMCTRCRIRKARTLAGKVMKRCMVCSKEEAARGRKIRQARKGKEGTK